MPEETVGTPAQGSPVDETSLEPERAPEPVDAGEGEGGHEEEVGRPASEQAENPDNKPSGDGRSTDSSGDAATDGQAEAGGEAELRLYRRVQEFETVTSRTLPDDLVEVSRVTTTETTTRSPIPYQAPGSTYPGPVG